MRRLTLATALSLLVSVGCGEAFEPDEAVPLDQVPEPVMKAARETLPGYKFESAYKIKVEGQEAYEVRGKDRQGRRREVEVLPSGKVVQVE